jgi:nucleotide-binding universal stress UspA family protein
MANEPMGPVVVGVDGSPVSMRALDLAAEEAVGRVTPLVVVYAQRSGGPADARLVGRRLLAVAESRARSEHPALAVTTELVTGYAADALVARSHEACLVVVGRRGNGGGVGLPIGSVALSVASRAASPVLVYRALDFGRFVVPPRPVLVGVDGLEPADAAVEFSFIEAELRGAPLHAVYVRPEPDGAQTDRHRRALSDAVAGWAGKYPDVPVVEQVRHGANVAETLIEASRGAQLAVVGASAPDGLSQLVLGSVSISLARHGGCPVAVVPLT